jgi:hypothetical protein
MVEYSDVFDEVDEFQKKAKVTIKFTNTPTPLARFPLTRTLIQVVKGCRIAY